MSSLKRKIEKIKRLFPQIQIEKEVCCNKNEYYYYISYKSHFNNCRESGNHIKTEYQKNLITDKTKIEFLKNYFLTKKESIDAIKKVLPKAKKRFLRVKKSIEKIEENFFCNVSLYLDGDSDGVDYCDSVYFEIEGFRFIFAR